MKLKATRGVSYLYYMGVAIISILFLISGFLEITRNPATYLKTLRMGYPPYFIATLGCAKIVGAVALWLPDYLRGIKEWVFAGFIFDVIFAFISGLQIDSLADCLKASVAFVFILTVYWLFRATREADLRIAD